MRRLFLLIILLTANLFAGSAPPTVADIAALKALAPGAYQTLLVLRYSSADSGKYAGGGLVNWIAGSTKAAAACSVYVPNSNPTRGRWERVSSSIRSAEQCGIHTYDDTISGVTTYPDLAGSGTRMVVVSATGTASTQSIPAGGSLANPTGTIGLTAVNGSLTSALRSDGAPALSQAIAPNWSGLHIFSSGLEIAGGSASGNAAYGDIFSNATNGLVLIGRQGATNDLLFANHSGQTLLSNPTGGTALTIPGVITNTALAGTGTRITTSTSTGVQGNATSLSGLYDFSDLIGFGVGLTFSGNGTSAAATITRLAADGLQVRGVAGSSYDITLQESGGSYLLRNPAGGTVVEFPGSGILMTSLAGTGTRMVVTDPSGNLSTQTIPVAGSLASPSATIGLTTVNGSATSGMRSDGAPALSQAIVPTWTGNHTHGVGTSSLWSGLGTPGSGNSEYLVINHDAGSVNLFSLASGTGTARGFSFGVGALNPLAISSAGKVFLNNSIEVSGISKFAGPTQPQKSALTSGATVAVNASLADFFTLTLATNATLSNPTNGAEGSHFTIRIRQDGTGSRILDYGTNYRFPSGIAPTLTTTANAIDYLSFIYDETDSKWDFVGNAFNLIAELP